jgi:hypothetical protein
MFILTDTLSITLWKIVYLNLSISKNRYYLKCPYTTGLAVAIVDLEGVILSQFQWKKLQKDFYLKIQKLQNGIPISNWN